MRLLATFAVSLLLATARPSLASSLPSEDSSSIFMPSNVTSPATSLYHFDERSGILTEFGPSSSLASALGKRDSFTASFGLMLERDVTTDPKAHRFQKRKHGDVTKRARDTSPREPVQLGFTKRGELVLPESVLAKRDSKQNRSKSSATTKNNNKGKKAKKHHAKKKKSATGLKMNKVARSTKSSSSTNGIQKSLIKLAASIPKISAYITWYTGVDLQKPYCADKSGWTPKDSSLIAAVTLDWGKGRPACGSFLQLKSPSNKKSVIVRLVDMCGGCKSGVPHVDLSKAAFQALYSLDVGKVADIEVSTLSGPPFSTWTSQLKALYGPQVL